MQFKTIVNDISEGKTPTSKVCSCCGNIKKDLKLKDRVYVCDKCGLEIDRDKNASINLGNYKIV